MKKHKLNTKKKVGFILLGLVFIYWIAITILPFLDIPNKALIITSLLVVGELVFVAAIALLGKEYWGQIKKRFYQIFCKKKKKVGGDIS
jgi:apolipoprotein N-acyltransferase